MFNSNEIQNAIAFYEVLKTDLNTLLVKGSKSPLDYLGEIETQPYAVTIEYQISEPNQNRETFDLLLDVGVILEHMVKTDIRLWDKTSGIRTLVVAPDHRCKKMVLEIVFQG